jgi:hypothetical protein
VDTQSELCKTVNVRIPLSVHGELRRIGFESGLNMSTVLTMAGQALIKERLEDKERNNGLR